MLENFNFPTHFIPPHLSRCLYQKYHVRSVHVRLILWIIKGKRVGLSLIKMPIMQFMGRVLTYLHF